MDDFFQFRLFLVLARDIGKGRLDIFAHRHLGAALAVIEALAAALRLSVHHVPQRAHEQDGHKIGQHDIQPDRVVLDLLVGDAHPGVRQVLHPERRLEVNVHLIIRR